MAGVRLVPRAARRALRVSALAWLLTAPAASAATPEESARIELTTFATLFAVGLGVQTSLELDLRPRPAAWLTAGLAGGALYGTWRLSEDAGLRPGDVRMVESAAAWAMVDSLLAQLAHDERPGLVWWSLGAGAVAGTVGVLATPTFYGSPGQVSLVNSGGLWTPVAGLLFGVTAHLGDGEHLARDVLLLNVAGLGAGLALSQRYDPTRDQVLYLDGGLLLGGLSGGLVGILVGVPLGSHEVITGLSLLGMGVGGAVAVDRAGFDRRRARRPRTNQQALMLPLWASSW